MITLQQFRDVPTLPTIYLSIKISIYRSWSLEGENNKILSNEQPLI